ncbi:MAG: phenylalanine--tRNA ligase subunit beta [Chloroflexi bacterium]|nr:phenylalanine--tRNA ligase subunit beta [Chloroflexota bacterium]
MRVPISWLNDFITIDIPLSELIRRLTMAGLESKLEYSFDIDRKIVVAEILEVKPHPNADKLRLVTVGYDHGIDTVVCGAPNLVVGDKVAFAKLGAQVKSNGQIVELKTANIRGVESAGMICAEDELGIGTSHEGIMILNHFAPLGEPVASVLGEVILNVEITPNRADCMSVLGIAYEVAAAMDKQVKLPQHQYEERLSVLSREKLKVRIIDPQVSMFYMGAYVEGVKVGPSPQWVQDRLLICGVRPICNVVDITNYVLLEFGQPLHAFDYDKLQTHSLTVRTAGPDDHFIALDGKEHILKEDMGVITDGTAPVALAGIIGGMSTAVDENTVNIALEGASFNATMVHNTARTLKINTEASLRFERGISPMLVDKVLRRAVYLILEICGGQTPKGLSHDILKPPQQHGINIEMNQVRPMLGMRNDDPAWSNPVMVKALTKFGFKWSAFAGNDDEFGSMYGKEDQISNGVVSVPEHRFDVKDFSDILEEVARGIGYDNLPVRLMSSELPHTRHQSSYIAKIKAREAMTRMGFWEIITHGLTSLEELKKTKLESEEFKPMPLKVLNPMADGQEYLRTNMRGALLTAIYENRKHQDSAIKLYELGHIFIPRGEDALPLEPEMIYAAMVGDKSGISWPSKAASVDFYTAKGCAEVLLAAFGIKADYVPSIDDGLLAGARADVMVDGKKIGVVGQVQPTVAQNFEINEAVYMLNFSLPAIISLQKTKIDYHPIIRLPKSERDIAVIVDKNVAAKSLLDLMQAPIVKNARLFDVYQGKQVSLGKKSLAFRLTLQDAGRTLTDKEMDDTVKNIVNILKEQYGAELRS